MLRTSESFYAIDGNRIPFTKHLVEVYHICYTQPILNSVLTKIGRMSDSELSDDSDSGLDIWGGLVFGPGHHEFDDGFSSSSSSGSSDDDEDDDGMGSFFSDTSSSTYEPHDDETIRCSNTPYMWYQWDTMFAPRPHECSYVNENFHSWPPRNWDDSAGGPQKAFLTLGLFRYSELCTNASFRRRLINEFRKRPYIQRVIFNLGDFGDAVESPHPLQLIQSDPDRHWKSIIFRGGNFDDETFEFIERILDSLEHVDSLAYIDAPTDLEFLTERLLKFPSLETLCVSSSMSSMLNVREFTECMERCTRLTQLSFENCVFDYADTDSRRGFSSVMDLTNGLSNVRHLKKLKLAQCGIDDATVCHMLAAFRSHPSLEHLDISGNRCYSEDSVKAVAALLSRKRSKLVKLDVSRLWRKKRNGRMTRIDFEPLYTALASNTRLKEFNISRNALNLESEFQFEALAAAIAANTSLVKLDIRGKDHLDHTAARYFFDALSKNRTLHSMLYSGCNSNWYWMHQANRTNLQFYPHLNFCGRRLLSQCHSVPLGLWPLIFERVNKTSMNAAYMAEDIPSVLHHMLRCPDGEAEIPLAVLIAMNQPVKARPQKRRRVKRSVDQSVPKRITRSVTRKHTSGSGTERTQNVAARKRCRR